MATVTFGIGGFGSRIRHQVATAKGDLDKIDRLAEALRELGFWTVMDREVVTEPTVIEIGEIITQKG